MNTDLKNILEDAVQQWRTLDNSYTEKLNALAAHLKDQKDEIKANKNLKAGMLTRLFARMKNSNLRYKIQRGQQKYDSLKNSRAQAAAKLMENIMADLQPFASASLHDKNETFLAYAALNRMNDLQKNISNSLQNLKQAYDSSYDRGSSVIPVFNLEQPMDVVADYEHAVDRLRCTAANMNYNAVPLKRISQQLSPNAAVPLKKFIKAYEDDKELMTQLRYTGTPGKARRYMRPIFPLLEDLKTKAQETREGIARTYNAPFHPTDDTLQAQREDIVSMFIKDMPETGAFIKELNDILKSAHKNEKTPKTQTLSR